MKVNYKLCASAILTESTNLKEKLGALKGLFERHDETDIPVHISEMDLHPYSVTLVHKVGYLQQLNLNI